MRSAGRPPALVAVMAAISLAGCHQSVEADCQKVGPGLLWQIQRATSSSITDAYAVPSRTQARVWLVGAMTDKGVAVWSTSLPPDGEGVSFVLNANQVAIDDSVVGVDVPPESDQPEALATKDLEGIAAAEGCLREAVP